MRALCLPDPKWLSKIKEYEPDVITWSTMTGNHQPIYDLNRLLKRKFDFFSLMGGPHVTFVPDAVKDPDIDDWRWSKPLPSLSPDEMLLVVPF